MAISYSFSMVDAYPSTLSFGAQTAASGDIIVGGCVGGTGNPNLQWNGTDLATQLVLDTNVYNNRDYESRIELSPAAGSHTLAFDGAVATIGWGAILAGGTGNYYELYGNPAGAATPSIDAYVDGSALIMVLSRNSYQAPSITSGGANLALLSQDYYAAFENFYMNLYACDTTATTLALSMTATAYDIVTFEATGAPPPTGWIPDPIILFL
jgi:hypothetical protein